MRPLKHRDGTCGDGDVICAPSEDTLVFREWDDAPRACCLEVNAMCLTAFPVIDPKPIT